MYGNGDVKTGDGYLYRGRVYSILHLNYMKIGGNDFVRNPDLILIPSNDVKGAIKYWKWKNLERLTEFLPKHVAVSSIGLVNGKHCRIALYPINQGYSNINERARFYNRYMNIFC